MFCAAVVVLCSTFLQSFRQGRESWLLSTCNHATVSVPCLFLMVWLVGLQYVIVVFSGLLGLPARCYTSHIVNRIAFRLKKDGPNIAFKS